MNRKIHHGGCHCGALQFRLQTSISPDSWQIRACQCSFCRAHDALSISDPGGSLEFACEDPDRLQRYRFGLKTADFLLCAKCGVYIGAVIETSVGKFGIVNAHALSDFAGEIAKVSAISYDGETTSERLSRREERWTPVTAVPWRQIG